MKKEAEREHWTEAQDIADHSTEANLATRKLGQTTSHMETDAFLKQEVITNTLSQAEAVKEEIAEKNTEVIERIRIGSNKICVREDLAKENMMFSQESNHAIFEMGNVELIELKNA